MTIGERIRARRKELNMTLKELHALTKISVGNLSEIENGKYLPSVPAIQQLSIALNCTTDWLLNDSLLGSYVKDPNNDYRTQLSEDELDIIHMYRVLDERDKQDLYDMLCIKSARHKR